jgi:uncharacterized protein (DUF1778 family)
MQEKSQEITKNARFDIRIPQTLKETVVYAAKLQGMNYSDFIVAAIANEAGRVINENHVIRLALRDQQALLAALNSPEKKPTEQARRAAVKYKKDVKNGRVILQH